MPFTKIRVPVSQIAPTGTAYVYDPKGKLRLPPGPSCWQKKTETLPKPKKNVKKPGEK